MKTIKTTGFLLCLLFSVNSHATRDPLTTFPICRPSLTFGLEYQYLNFGGEDGGGNSARGIFVGVPLNMAGRGKSRFVMQPDFSVCMISDQFETLRNGWFSGGINMALKYMRVGNRTRFGIGPRLGFHGVGGLCGLTLDFDYRVAPRWMLGINANTQFYPGAEIEGYSGFKLQLTKLIWR